MHRKSINIANAGWLASAGVMPFKNNAEQSSDAVPLLTQQIVG
jgi:hypothetical protein